MNIEWLKDWEQFREINQDDLMQLAQDLAVQLGGGTVLTLDGELGSGKSTFVRSLGRALGISGDMPSPTFTLYELYPLAGGLSFVHFDLYRIQSEYEARNLDWEEIWASPRFISVIEWPHVLERLIPYPRFEIFLKYTKDFHEDIRLCRILYTSAR